jgi:hypothetical protein
MRNRSLSIIGLSFLLSVLPGGVAYARGERDHVTEALTQTRIREALANFLNSVKQRNKETEILWARFASNSDSDRSSMPNQATATVRKLKELGLDGSSNIFIQTIDAVFSGESRWDLTRISSTSENVGETSAQIFSLWARRGTEWVHVFETIAAPSAQVNP